MIQIAMWPDGTWCELEDIEAYLHFMSDDYEIKQVTTLKYYELCFGD
jgi:hypothetical protein